jgi:hypothetical protein
LTANRHNRHTFRLITSATDLPRDDHACARPDLRRARTFRPRPCPRKRPPHRKRAKRRPPAVHILSAPPAQGGRRKVYKEVNTYRRSRPRRSRTARSPPREGDRTEHSDAPRETRGCGSPRKRRR